MCLKSISLHINGFKLSMVHCIISLFNIIFAFIVKIFQVNWHLGKFNNFLKYQWKSTGVFKFINCL